MLKLLTSRNVISGMAKRFNGIWSKDLRQTMEKAITITEKMEKIVQHMTNARMNEHKKENFYITYFLDALISERSSTRNTVESYRKENKQQKMDEFKSEMDELKRAFLTSHQQIEKEFNEKLKKMIEEQQQMAMLCANPGKSKNGKFKSAAWNRWEKILIQGEIEDDEGLYVSTEDSDMEWHNVFALNGFPISHKHCGNVKDITEITTYYFFYYEVSVQCNFGDVMVGLSGGLPADYIFDECHPNFYYLENIRDYCCLSGTTHDFELPNVAIKPEFMEAKQAASFYIKIVSFDFDDMRKIQAPFSLQNSQTGEKLVITKMEVEEGSEDYDLTISRFPIGTNEKERHDEMAQYSDSDNRWDNVGQ